MPAIKRNATLPTAAMPAPQTTFEFDENTNELVVTARFSFDYPDEAVINRYGRLPRFEKGHPKEGEPTGEPKPVTQKTYGLAHKVFTGSADAEDNPMFVNIRLFAPTKEAAEGEEGDTADTE